MNTEFDSILLDGEKIKWEGKPKFEAFIFSSLGVVIVGIILLAMVIGFSSLATKGFSSFSMSGVKPPTRTVNGMLDSAGGMIGKTGSIIHLFILPFYVITIGMILSPLFKAFAYKKEKYAFTDRRVIISRGFIGQELKTIDYENIKNSTVSVSAVDKLFSVGSINIFTGEIGNTGGSNAAVYSRSDCLIGLTEAHEAYKILKSLADVKSGSVKS